jgi:hypothetical protein
MESDRYKIRDDGAGDRYKIRDYWAGDRYKIRDYWAGDRYRIGNHWAGDAFGLRREASTVSAQPNRAQSNAGYAYATISH